MTRAIVLLSGGKDSAIALWWARRNFDEVRALSISHPERPRKERAAASRLAELSGCPITEIDVPFIKSTRTLRPGQGDDFGTAGAYVPMRNLVIFAAAGHFAEEYQANAIVAGQLKSDGQAYQDATQKFFRQLTELFRTSLSGSFLGPPQALSIKLPLITLSDAQAIRLGLEMGVPFEVTWSCLRDVPTPCGTCVSCRDRKRVLSV